LKQAYDYWQNQPDLNCVPCAREEELPFAQAVSILMIVCCLLLLFATVLELDKVSLGKAGLPVVTYRSFLLTSFLADIPENAASNQAPISNQPSFRAALQ